MGLELERVKKCCEKLYAKTVLANARLLPLLKLAIPFLLAGAAILAIRSFAEPEVQAKYAVVFFIYFFNPLGMEVGIPTGLRMGLHPAPLLTFILFVDATAALFLVWNISHAEKIPGVGGLLRRTEERGRDFMRRHTWVRRLGFVGLVLFVMLPIYGTGAITGSVIGRILGMSPLRVWLAVVLGSGLRSGLITLVALGALRLF
ncbi:MAG: small multi-drug export protein [Candidatus Alkanophagales archaeon]